MNHSMLLLLGAAAFACTIGLCRAGVYKDLAQCTTEEVEKCGVDFVPYFGGNTLAVNAADLEKQCTEYHSQLKCSDDFSVKCLDGLPKGTILLMLRAARDEYDAICNVTSPRHQEMTSVHTVSSLKAFCLFSPWQLLRRLRQLRQQWSEDQVRRKGRRGLFRHHHPARLRRGARSGLRQVQGRFGCLQEPGAPVDRGRRPR
ncbi:unnamed protein product [Ixodes pacificus]